MLYLLTLLNLSLMLLSLPEVMEGNLILLISSLICAGCSGFIFSLAVSR